MSEWAGDRQDCTVEWGMDGCPSPCPGVCSNSYPWRWNSCPWSQWCYLTISSSTTSFFFCLQSVLAFLCSSHQVAKVLELQAQNIQDWFPSGLTGLISLQSKGLSSSPAPQFKSIHSLALSLLYGPTLTSVHDYWENRSSGYTDFCWQSDFSAF